MNEDIEAIQEELGSLPAPAREKGIGKTKKRLPAVATVLANINAGLTCQEIAKLYGVGEAAVRSFCSRNGLSLRDIKNWRRTRADLLSVKQSQMLEAMTPEKMERASVRDLAGAMVGLHGIERLERGQSTSNIDLAETLGSIADLTRAENELRAKLGMTLLPDAEHTP